MAFFGFGTPTPKSLVELKRVFNDLESRAEFAKAARIARDFAKRAENDASLQDEERWRRLAIGMALLARSAFCQVVAQRNPDHEILTGFFFAHSFGFWCFQKFLKKDGSYSDWNEEDPNYADLRAMDKLYDDLYERFPKDILSVADTEGNEIRRRVIDA